MVDIKPVLTEKLFNEKEEYINSLSPSSGKLVRAICPECKKERALAFSDVKKAGHTFCKGCNKRKRSCDWMIGNKFGRLTVNSYAEPRKYKGGGFQTMFSCTCECGAQVVVYASHIKSGHTTSCGCSRAEMLIGETNPNYNPNIPLQERNGKRGYAITRWATQVKRRDDFTCQVCGSKQKLIAHHLNSYKSDKENRYNVENGITLCRECHTDFHCNFMGDYRQPCNEEDFEQYLLQV